MKVGAKVLVAAGVALSLVLPVTLSGASVSSATALQVRQMVVSSTKTTRLSPLMKARLVASANDFSWSNYPKLSSVSGSTCDTATACVYGDAQSKRSLVLFGDSHALMWLPAVVPFAVAHKLKVVVLWQGACPPGTLSVYYPSFAYPDLCNIWRSQMIAVIKTIDPVAVLLAARTSDVKSSRTQYFTNAQWEAGLVTTVGELASSSTKVAIIEDTVTFNESVPACLALHVSAVQDCAVTDPNVKHPGLQRGEEAAATKSKALFIATKSWFCTTVCPAVIADYVPFVDTNHVSFAYARFLSGVMGDDLARLV